MSSLLLGFPQPSTAIKTPTSLCIQLLLKGCDENAGFDATSTPNGVILGGTGAGQAQGPGPEGCSGSIFVPLVTTLWLCHAGG